MSEKPKYSELTFFAPARPGLSQWKQPYPIDYEWNVLFLWYLTILFIVISWTYLQADESIVFLK